MRRIAAGRYKDGLMPPWFKTEWLDIEEAPTNTWWRNQGLSAYRTDTTWLGENAPSASSGDGSSGGEFAEYGQVIMHSGRASGIRVQKISLSQGSGFRIQGLRQCQGLGFRASDSRH